MHYAHSDLLARDATVKELLRPLQRFLDDEAITEICINRPGTVFIEAGAQWERVAVPELTLEHCWSLATAVATFTEQIISAQKPILSAMLPNGERLQVLVPPAVEPDRVSFTIRRPSSAIKSLEQYDKEGAFGRFVWARSPQLDERKADLDPIERTLIEHLETNRLPDFLKLAVREHKNIAVVGNTGSGKTTLMKTLCQEIPTNERLVTIEDVRELHLPHHENCMPLLYSKDSQGVAQVTPSDLIASTMRMKPDRVLLAELRGGEAFDFLKLLTTGHSGSITSYHAESCALAYERYVFMSKEHPDAAVYDAPALKHLVSLTLDIIIHIVARTVYDNTGQSSKDRYVSEIHYDPIAKLQARFGSARLHHA